MVSAPAIRACQRGGAISYGDRSRGGRSGAVVPQHAAPAPASCTGGHGTEPYEQNTQQSPAFGRSNAPQPAHSWKNAHASVGMSTRASWPHAGHRSSEVSTGECMVVIYAA